MSNHWKPCKVPETPQRGKVEERNPGQLVFNRGANCTILLLENLCINFLFKDGIAGEGIVVLKRTNNLNDDS